MDRGALNTAREEDRTTKSLKVCVIGGAGYVGLITGVGLATMGHHVVAVDVNEPTVASLQSGTPSFYEDGLTEALRKCLDASRIRFTTRLAEAVREVEVILIAVGTPSKDDGHADLSQVIRVAEDLAEQIAGYKVVIVKSTVPVGTVELVRSILGRRRREGEEFDIVANPEFLREGRGLTDFFYPDRIVVGTSSARAREIMRILYEPVEVGRQSRVGTTPPAPVSSVPVVETDLASAQMIKYASNSFLAMRISFINEIAAMCERVGADVREVTRGLGYDPRIGSSYLQPGLGFGGPCLEKDLRALIRIGEETRYEPRLLRSILERNEQQLREIVSKIKDVVGYLLYRRIVVVFGLAFKGGTSDVRNSPSLRLMEELEREGAVVRGYDPVVTSEALSLRPTWSYYQDPYEAVEGADGLVIATDWPQLRMLDYQLIGTRMSQRCVIDARNLLDPRAMRELGFRYAGVGVP